MKRTALFSLFALMLTIILPACHEDVFMNWKLKNATWMEAHKSDSGFVTTSTGLMYKVIHQGDQRHPNVNSTIIVTYKGTLVDGSTFDSGTSAGFLLSQTIAGWKEGIAKMQDGGHYIFYVPSSLAYDTTSTNAAIPPYSNLIFDVTLIKSYN